MKLSTTLLDGCWSSSNLSFTFFQHLLYVCLRHLNYRDRFFGVNLFVDQTPNPRKNSLGFKSKSTKTQGSLHLSESTSYLSCETSFLWRFAHLLTELIFLHTCQCVLKPAITATHLLKIAIMKSTVPMPKQRIFHRNQNNDHTLSTYRFLPLS